MSLDFWEDRVRWAAVKFVYSRRIPRSSRVQRFDAGQPSHRTRRCILLNNLRIIMIMPVMAMLRGNSSDYTVVAMITDALAFNRFTIISVAAVANGAARTKVYNYREATLWRLLLGVPLCQRAVIIASGKKRSTRKKISRARFSDSSFFRFSEGSYGEIVRCEKSCGWDRVSAKFFFFFWSNRRKRVTDSVGKRVSCKHAMQFFWRFVSCAFGLVLTFGTELIETRT